MIEISQLVYLVLLGAAMVTYAVSATVFYFVEGREGTPGTNRKTIGICGILLILGIITAVMARYFVEFPEIRAYDANSDANFIIGIITALFTFVMYIPFVRAGEHLARLERRPGSLYLRGEFRLTSIDWKAVLLPLPFLYLWTFILFGLLKPEASELAEAMTPKEDSLLTWVYLFLSVSVMAPLSEEILFRHYAMGFLYHVLGTGKAAVFFNLLITATVFGIAHVSILTEDWIKILQVIPLGMVLGYVNDKRGIEHSILLHAFFNTFSFPLSAVVDHFVSGFS